MTDIHISWLNLVFLIFTLVLIDPVIGQTLKPNHVSLNEKRKHIDVDSTWLDKKSDKVQEVGSERNLGSFFTLTNTFLSFLSLLYKLVS